MVLIVLAVRYPRYGDDLQYVVVDYFCVLLSEKLYQRMGKEKYTKMAPTRAFTSPAHSVGNCRNTKKLKTGTGTGMFGITSKGEIQ